MAKGPEQGTGLSRVRGFADAIEDRSLGAE